MIDDCISFIFVLLLMFVLILVLAAILNPELFRPVKINCVEANHSHKTKIVAIVSSVVAGVIGMLLVAYCIHRRRKNFKGNASSSDALEECSHISYLLFNLVFLQCNCLSRICSHIEFHNLTVTTYQPRKYGSRIRKAEDSLIFLI